MQQPDRWRDPIAMVLKQRMQYLLHCITYFVENKYITLLVLSTWNIDKTELLSDYLIHWPSTTAPILFNKNNYFQAYIEAENKRLENDPSQFSAKEIIIRIEYKHCPNLTIIDTPGLILAAPGRKNRVLQVLY